MTAFAIVVGCAVLGQVLCWLAWGRGKRTTLRVSWADGISKDVVFRKRWFPWLSNNVCLGSTVYVGHYIVIMVALRTYAPTIRHEVTHSRQVDEHSHFYWRYLFQPSFRHQMELEAMAAEQASAPIGTVVYPAFMVIR